jgi:A/G-specific adenine glycosylase
MLQQTRLQVVEKKYLAFMGLFPTVRDLAEADSEDVKRAWEGLGYYRRAEALHRAARVVMTAFGGRVPHGKGEFLSLPGVGPYTEAAVMSISFEQDLPVVDGNVIRVFSRIYRRVSTNPGDYWDDAMLFMLDAKGHMGNEWDPGDFNQAIMEFGQRICTKQPACLYCPIRGDCQAHTFGVVSQFPVVKPRKTKSMTVKSVVVRSGDTVLLQKSTMGAMSGFYEFLDEVPSGVHVSPMGTFSHTIQDTRYKVNVFEGFTDIAERGIWVHISDLASLTMTGIARKTKRTIFGD